MATAKPMTEQEVAALKAELTKAVDATIQPDMTREDALKAVADAILAMKPQKDLGSMSDSGGLGDMESMAEDQGGTESEQGAGEQ